MVKKLVFGFLYSEFDETRGPVPVVSYPEISREFGTNIASKSIDILTNLGVLICLIFALWTEWYLWKMYKNRKAPEDKSIT